MAAGYNFIEGEDFNNPIDKHGHGTHVAGIIAAKGTLTGVSPDATLYAYKVLNDQGWGMESGIIAAIEKAMDPDGNPLTDDQVDVINMSLGGGGAPDSPQSEAANNAMAAGVIVVVAAGNNGSSYSTIGSPGNASQVLTVGASDNEGGIAYFSSRGPITGKSYVKPELVAPGVEINSAKPGGSYIRLNGTSMATPHVAGGAALLRQLYPTLSSAEIKTLLINTSRDLGEDAFTQGAGMTDLQKAATVPLLVSPALLSAGVVDLTQANWAANLPIKLKNIGKTSLAVEAIAPEQLPVGTTVSVSGKHTLAPSEEAEAAFRLAVDTKTLPFAESNTLYHEAAAGVRFSGQDIRLPLVFSKSAKLKIEFNGSPWVLDVVNADDNHGSSHYFNSCTEIPADFSLDLKPGTYHLSVLYYNEFCGVESLVFKENVVLQEQAEVRLSPADAVHELSVGRVIDRSGRALSLDGMIVQAQSLEWLKESSGSALFMGAGSKRIIKVSDISDSVKVAVSSFFALKETFPGVEGEYYLVNETFEEGINQSYPLDLDTRTNGKIEFTYADHDVLAQGVTFTIGVSQLRSIFDFAAFGSYMRKSDVHGQPVKATLYGAISQMHKGEWYPDISVNQLSDDPFAWFNLDLMRTGLLGFLSTNSFIKLGGAFSTPDEINYRSLSPELSITDSASFVAPVFYFSAWNNELQIKSGLGSWPGDRFTIQKDAQQNNFYDLMPYRFYCDGEIKSNADITGESFNILLGTDTCKNARFELDQPVRFLGETSQSRLRLEFDTSKIEGQNTYLFAEFLEQLQFFNDGAPSRIMNGSNPELHLDMRSLSESSAGIEDEMMLELRLENGADWQPLTLTRAAHRYTARLPVIAGAQKASLRITLVNHENGAKLVQTLDRIIELGRDAKGDLEERPVFDYLPRLDVEAKARLTDYVLPNAYAGDAKDGLISAITTDVGPYAVGVHNIRWQATNASGKTGSAFQVLEVRDTTAPVIQQPASITVEATGALTDIPQPRVTAHDLVDGEIIAWTNDWRSFPVGTHTVIWNASDSRFNQAHIIQMVTVRAAGSGTSSSAASSRAPVSNPGGSSGGGGGGSISLWIVLLSSLFLGAHLGRVRR